MNSKDNLPIAVIGAGPIGLATAANLVERNLEPLVLEAGSRVAASMWDWGHVKLFTPWSYLIDPTSQRLLAAPSDWKEPDPEYVPYSREFVEQYLLLGETYDLRHKLSGGEISAVAVPDFTIPVRAIFDKQENLKALQTLLSESE